MLFHFQFLQLHFDSLRLARRSDKESNIMINQSYIRSKLHINIAKIPVVK